MPRKNHTHKYQMRATGSHNVWACALPDCNHYMPPNLTPLIEGRSSICWECEDKFILDVESMKEVRPRCFDCRNDNLVKAIDLVMPEPEVSDNEKRKAITNFMKGI